MRFSPRLRLSPLLLGCTLCIPCLAAAQPLATPPAAAPPALGAPADPTAPALGAPAEPTAPANAAPENPAGTPMATPIPSVPQPSPAAPLPQPPNAPVAPVAPTAAAPTIAAPVAAPPPAAPDATTSPSAPPAPYAATADQPPPPETREERGPCLLGPLCIGPVFSLGLPNLLGFGVQVRFTDYLGAAFDYQVMPKISWNAVSAGWSLVSVEGRVHPFGGSLFAAGGVAIQHFFGRGSVEAPDPNDPQQNAPIQLRGSVTVPSLKLGLGFMDHDGFVIGMDAALLFQLSSTRLNFETEGGIADIPEVQAEMEKIRERSEMVLNSLPFLVQFNLIRIGYIF